MLNKTFRHIVFLTCIFICLLFDVAVAQNTISTEGKTLNISSYIIFAEDAGREAFEVDSLFYLRSLPIVFAVNRTDINADNRELQHFIRYAVPLIKGENIRNARIRIRSAASPEGPLRNNKRLSKGRRDALLKVFEEHGVNATELQIDVVDEEYELLAFAMRQAGDPDAALVSRMVSEGISDPVKLKKQLIHYQDGDLWHRIKAIYFPALRASRFMIIFPENHAGDIMSLGIQPLRLPTPDPAPQVKFPTELSLDNLFRQPMPVVVPHDSTRREMLSVKTNMLGWGLVIPQYGGWCPIPNVALEYYPAHGHMTYGASLDCPWWVGNTTNHKYMEVRNYQLETRYYLRNSDRSYTEGGAAYKGWYGQAYLQAGLYEIGFSAKKGWIGEALGGGLGFGYVLPFTKLEHWRLEFGAQFGYFVTQYDPFVYGKPIYHGGEIDGLYYYNTPLYRKDFVKRQHRFTWLGPTRVGITISYDLLYRRHGSKRPSFSRWEKGGEL